MQTTLHVAGGVVYVDGYKSVLLEYDGFGKHGDIVAFVKQVEYGVHLVGFDGYLEVQIPSGYDVVKSASCLQADAGKHEFVIFEV